MDRIMIVEDDLKLCKIISEHLKRYGYSVFITEDFKNIEEQFYEVKPDLLLLDVNLPYYDGFFICKSIRRKSKTPMIIISARSSEMDQVMGIGLGADDFIVKPFKLEVLLAKITAVLRRAKGEFSATNGNLVIGEMELEQHSFKLLYKEKFIELSKNEFLLLKAMMENKDKIINREDLLCEVWDDSSFVGDNTLTVNITRIKSKLSELGINDIIKTKRGAGYFFDSKVLE